jgi:hypothetical protein
MFGLLALVAPASARAQGQAGGQGGGQAGGGAGGAGGATIEPGTSVFVTYSGTFSDNPSFTAIRGPGDRLDSLAGGFSHTFSRRRSQLSLMGQGGTLLYRNDTLPFSLTYAGTALLSHQFSNRASLTVTQLANGTFTSESPDLIDEGLLLQQSRMRTNSTTAGFGMGLSNSFSASLRGSYVRRTFGTSDLVNGSVLMVAPGLSWKVSRDSTLGLSYSFGRSQNNLQPAIIQSLSATGSTSLFRRRARVGLAAGISRVAAGAGPVVATGGPSYAMTGSATVGATFWNGEWAARYNRSVGQSFGQGRQRVANLVALSWNSTLFWGVTATVSYSYGSSADPFDQSFQITTESYQAGLGYTYWKLTLSGDYSWRRNLQEAAPDIVSKSLRALVSFRQTWGAPRAGRRRS